MARGLIAVTSDTRLGGLGDLRLRLLVERPQQRALGDVDEVAPVDDRGARPPATSARARAVSGRCGRARPACRPAGAPRRGRRRRAPRRGRRAARRSASGARRRRFRARSGRPAPTTNRTPKASADQAERLGLGEQALDQIGRPQAERERDEAAEAGPEHAGEAEPPAREEPRLLRRLDLALGLVDRRRRGRRRNRVVLRRMTAAGASGAGPSSTATRASSRRKARGRGGRSVMPGGRRSGIAGRGRAGCAGRAVRAG